MLAEVLLELVAFVLAVGVLPAAVLLAWRGLCIAPRFPRYRARVPNSARAIFRARAL